MCASAGTGQRAFGTKAKSAEDALNRDTLQYHGDNRPFGPTCSLLQEPAESSGRLGRTATGLRTDGGQMAKRLKVLKGIAGSELARPVAPSRRGAPAIGAHARSASPGD